MNVQNTRLVVLPHIQDALPVDVSSMTSPTTGIRAWLVFGLEIVESKGDPEKRLKQIATWLRRILRALGEPIYLPDPQ